MPTLNDPGLATMHFAKRSEKEPNDQTGPGNAPGIFARPLLACNDRNAGGLAVPSALLSGRFLAMTTSQGCSAGLVQSLSAGLALVVALLGLAGATASTAKADAIDNAFLAAVKARGINFPSPQTAIIAGHEVCNELDNGRQKSDVANEVMNNSQLDGYHAGFFVGASVAAFCPRHRSPA